MEQKLVCVGLSVIIYNNGKILLGKRKGHGEGTWAFPGGHLEFGESWEECAVREVKEETNLEIGNIRFLTVTNDIFKNPNKHYITLFVAADYVSGKVRLMEPVKSSEWRWFETNKIPKPLFLPLINLFEAEPEVLERLK